MEFSILNKMFCTALTCLWRREYQFLKECLSLTKMGPETNCEMTQHPHMPSTQPGALISPQLKLCPQLNFLSSFLSVSCSQPPVSSHQHTSHLLLLVDPFFSFCFISSYGLGMSIAEWSFRFPFPASRHRKKQMTSPAAWGKWGKTWMDLIPIRVCSSLLLSSGKRQFARRRESPPAAGFSGSFSQEAGELGRQAIWKAFLVTEPEFFRGLEVPMSSCNLSQKPITHH